MQDYTKLYRCQNLKVTLQSISCTFFSPTLRQILATNMLVIAEDCDEVNNVHHVGNMLHV